MDEKIVKKAVATTLYIFSILGTISSLLLLTKQFWEWVGELEGEKSARQER